MRVFSGKVISKKMPKTATVLVTRIIAHRIYKKRIKRTKKYQVHDELNVNIGDTVLFKDSRPVSKSKSWKIVKVVKR